MTQRSTKIALTPRQSGASPAAHLLQRKPASNGKISIARIMSVTETGLNPRFPFS
jgi:hypothetical protein